MIKHNSIGLFIICFFTTTIAYAGSSYLSPDAPIEPNPAPATIHPEDNHEGINHLPLPNLNLAPLNPNLAPEIVNVYPANTTQPPNSFIE